jgi:histidyl-tRNA synthetase
VSFSFQNIKGTFDVLPAHTGRAGTHEASSAGWQHVERTIREVLGRFHMDEIRTPVLEPTELVARSIGELTDIVQKEMFSFERSGTNYVLRPEVTAPVMRAYLQHHLDQLGGSQRLFYIGPCFRAENPQKGRYRQFHQFGGEIIGTEEPEADAECIASMMAVYDALGIENMRLRLNSLGDAESRPRYREALKDYLQPYSDELTETSQQRLDSNPLRILDTKDEREQELLEDAPRLTDYIDEASRAHYEGVKGYLGDLGIAFEEDPFLVRGLDYYTRTAFELESDDLGAQSALAGGGRYDLLAEELGSERRVPAVGFAAGMERLFIALRAAGRELPAPDGPDVFIVTLGDEATRWALKEAQELRAGNLRVSLDLRDRSIGKQFGEADREEARFAVVVGDQELEAGNATVKEMASGDEEDVPFRELAEYLRDKLENSQSSIVNRDVSAHR